MIGCSPYKSHPLTLHLSISHTHACTHTQAHTHTHTGTHRPTASRYHVAVFSTSHLAPSLTHYRSGLALRQPDRIAMANTSTWYRTCHVITLLLLLLRNAAVLGTAVLFPASFFIYFFFFHLMKTLFLLSIKENQFGLSHYSSCQEKSGGLVII